MAEDRQSFSIKEDKSGTVHVACEVVAIIAGLAATEVEGVSSMAGTITDDSVEVNLSLNIAYGYSIPEVSNRVQERVKAAIENMTGLQVLEVNIRIASVDMENSK